MEVLRDHGCTILLYACLIVIARLMVADFELTEFTGRTISQATLDGISIARRTALYTSSIFVFVAAGATLIAIFALLRRWITTDARSLLEASSIGGLILLYLAAYKSFPKVSLQLLFAFQALIALVAVTDRWIAGRRLRSDSTAYVAWLFAAGVGVWIYCIEYVLARSWPAPALFAPAVCVFGFALHLLVLAVRAAGSKAHRARRVEAFLRASLPVFFLPAVSVASLELCLLANNARIGWVNAVGPEGMRLVLLGLLLVWGAVRFSRALVGAPREGEFALDRMLARIGFPVLLAGAISFLWYMPLLEPSTDLMEPANPGLMIQQWFEFGRWPFIETFNAHGLSDAVFGLLYAALTGFPGVTWQFYDHLTLALNALAAYWLLWKVTDSPYLAIFSVACLPYVYALFPEYCVLALVTVGVLRWVLSRSSTGAWFAFFLYLASCVLWRIDLGVANGVASIATLIGVRWMSATRCPPMPPIVRGAVAASVTFAGALLLLCLAKGVDPTVLARDLLNILASNQGFGGSRLAQRRNDVFIWHHFLIPLLMFLAGCALLVRWRGKVDPRAPAWSFLALSFMGAYYFANLPRGLVRHTFLEAGNVYLSSFAFAIAGLLVYGLASLTRARSFGVFVLVSSSLAYNFSLDNPAAKTADERKNLCEDIAVRIPLPHVVPIGSAVIERSPMPEWFKEKHTRAILEFLDQNLTPEQTFLDLSHSPMLYVFAHRRSPHYLNHLLLVHNDYLQDRVIEDLEKQDVPLVLLKTEPRLSQRDGAADLSGLDGVPFEFRHYRLYEYVYEHYEPLRIVQRWHVWARKDWMPPAPRPAQERAVCWTLGAERAPTKDDVVGDARSDRLELRGVRGWPAEDIPRAPLLLDPDFAYALRIAGASPRGGTLDLAWSVRGEDGARDEERRVAWPPGEQDRQFLLPGSSVPRHLDRLRCDGSGVPDLALTTFELYRVRAPDRTALRKALEAPRADEMRSLPYVWGAYDPRDKPFEIERLLLGESVREGEDAIELELKRVPLTQWPKGVHRERAGVLLEDLEVAQTIRPGDRLELAESGEREVVEVEGRRVWLDGAPLDQNRDGHPRRVIWHHAVRTSVVLRAEETALYRFETLGAEAGGSYLVVRLRNLGTASRNVYVDYGEDLDSRGRFVFAARNDGADHEYVLRTSMQYNWAARPKNWVAISPQGGGVELSRVFIARGD